MRWHGATPAEAFEQVALAFMGVIVDTSSVSRLKMIRICCDASDAELLLVDWLNALA